ncbi:MFS transporter [Actinospica sp.]|jgi:MFS family permease|uniref:MFS transporter n=1 Tax=Actinospica sp. TaxID=1872142 RepID=UPI002D00C7DD|nr:MFS transporter [Actinospica sp.]HWG26557.1 MFS transporter [Actinospica sp.]
MKRLIPGDGLDLLRRNRRFRRYYFARMSSVIGSQFTYAAVPLVVLADYRDPLAAGIVSACGYGGNIAFGIVAGLIVDRVPHRAIMLVADCGRFVLLIALGLLLLGPHLPPITVVYATVLLVAVFSAAFSAADSAMSPRVVQADDFAQALTMSSTRDSAISLLAPMISAAIVVEHPAIPFLVDSASYLISFVFLRTVRVPAPEPRQSPAREPWLRTATAGFSALSARRSLLLLTVGTGVLNFGLQVCVYLTLFRAVQQGHASLAGVILGLQSVGLLVGSVFAKRVFTRIPPADITAVHAVVWAGSFIVFAAVRSVWAACIVLPLMWTTAPTFRTVISTHTVAVVPERALGRVNAAMSLIAMSVAALSQTSAAFAVTRNGTSLLLGLLASAAVSVLLGGVALPTRTARMSLPCHGRQNA